MTLRPLVFALVLMSSNAVLGQERGGPPPTPPPEPPSLVSVAGGHWGVVGGLIAPANTNVVEAGLGWPGIHASFHRGFNNNLELGGRFTFNYGVEGLVGPVVPGVKLQALAHYKFFDNGKLSFGLRFEPGVMFYFYPASGVITCTTDAFGNTICGRGGNTVVGIALPIGVRMGLVVTSALNIGVSFDLPLWVAFGRTTNFLVPVLVGGGVEYFLQSNLLLYFNVKMGPTLSTAGGTAIFTFESKIGVGYRL